MPPTIRDRAIMSIRPATNLNLETLDRAVDLVRVNRLSDGSPEATFLRTYPAVLVAARARDRAVTETFLMTAAFAYGWMPGTLRVDPRRLEIAARAFETARAEGAQFSEQSVSAVAACLHSLVAASKVLHFASPAIYPTWDSRIERFRQGATPSIYHMSQTENYVTYVADVQGLKREEGFLGFHHDYCMNYQERLRQLAIPPYPLTDLRVIESAVYEIIAAGSTHG
jgi:hypothetical protein